MVPGVGDVDGLPQLAGGAGAAALGVDGETLLLRRDAEVLVTHHQDAGVVRAAVGRVVQRQARAVVVGGHLLRVVPVELGTRIVVRGQC